MSIYLAVDGGTTNTRVGLVIDRVVLAQKKLSYGVKSVNRDTYIRRLRDAMLQLLGEYRLEEEDVNCVLASGMITSEYGLFELPHLPLPAGLQDLHRAVYPVEISELFSRPTVFLRGVKSADPSLDAVDMMRGEETEVYGIYREDLPDAIYVLPGSHSKVIRFDEIGRICEISTMMTGEMLAALSAHTILSDAVSLSFKTFDGAYLYKGYQNCEAYGLNHALFQTRLLHTQFQTSEEERYSFFMGAVLHDEVEQILRCEEKNIVIGGQKQLREALGAIIKERSDRNVLILSDQEVKSSVFLGAVRIYEV